MDDFFDSFKQDREKISIVEKISDIPSNYVGSKRRLLSHIVDVLQKENVQYDSVFDAFSGSAMVSLLFKHLGKKVYCNDLLTSSALTAVCLLELEKSPLDISEINNLCSNVPRKTGAFVLNNYKNKFFTEKECNFLDRYRANVKEKFGEIFYSGIRTKESITYDKQKYKGSFSLFVIENHINKYCFLGGRYYNGQTIANMEHRLKHDKNKGKNIDEIPITIDKIDGALIKGNNCTVFNSDIIELLESNVINTDLVYLDPPYGKASSDYAVLYRFLEEYIYEKPLEDLEHIQRGGKRFNKPRGYQEQFDHLLSLCNKFKTLLISYNESSYADIDTIVSSIKNSGKKDVKLFDIPITYQYRKGKGITEMDYSSYLDNGKKHLQRGTEYLILAT